MFSQLTATPSLILRKKAAACYREIFKCRFLSIMNEAGALGTLLCPYRSPHYQSPLNNFSSETLTNTIKALGNNVH